MRNKSTLAFLVSAIAVMPASARAQDAASVRAEIMRHFDVNQAKLVALADATPADKFGWKPSEPARTVAGVYAHVAADNIWYLTHELKLAAPAGIKLDTLENVRDKAQILALLRRTSDYVKTTVAAIPDAQLGAQATLYGRPAPQWSVLMELVTHMSEHLGQSIAYARANNIVPPWSK